MKNLAKIFLLLAAQALIAAQSVPSSLEGIVTDQLTGSPISKATLDLQSTTDSTVRYPAVTASDGRFVFRNVLPGRYSLTAIRSGYVRSQFGQRGPNSSTATILVTSGQSVLDVRIWMVQSSVISGRLLDVDGEPVADAQVHAWKISYRDGFRTMVPIDSQASDDLGEYRLFGLPPGQYYVTAQPESRSFIRSPAYAALGPPIPGAVVTSFSAGQSGAITDPATSTRAAGKDYAPVFYGNTTDQFSATPINLPAGTDLRSVDIAISRIPLGTIAGKVFDVSTGQPTRATVTASPIGPNTPFTTLSNVGVTGGRIVVDNGMRFSVNPGGEFTGPMLPQGKYLLTAFLDAQGRRMSGQSILELGSANLTDARILISPVPDVSGRVTIESGPGVAAAAVERVKVGLKSTVSVAMDLNPQPVSAAGTFTLRNETAGDYVVTVSPGMEKGYVKSIKLGNADILNDGFHAGNMPDGEMLVIIGMNPGIIAGVARDESGGPLPNMTVVLLPDEYHRNRFDLYQSALSDAAGKYRFDRVPPGAYRIFAWEDVETDAWRNPAFMRLHENRGKGIIVVEGSSTNADLEVIRMR
jgi:protocatechuate 3,4-dioxygenase beta subunit